MASTVSHESRPGLRAMTLTVFLLSLIQAKALHVNNFNAPSNNDASQINEEKCHLQSGMELDMCDLTSPRELEHSQRSAPSGKENEQITVATGTRCMLDATEGLVNVLTCEDGEWVLSALHGKNTSIYNHSARVKRNIGTKLLCFLRGCPKNRAPLIKCPTVPSRIYADKRRVDRVVIWPKFYATDPEDGRIRTYRSSGQGPGSRFAEGKHTIRYLARDRKGLQSSCTISFTVSVRRCPSSYYVKAIPHGRVTCSPSGYIYGSKCSYKCDAGYEIRGASSVECISSQRWSASRPSCNIISCGTPQKIPGRTIICWNNNHVYRSMCVISCNRGYILFGSRTITCQANKQWTTPGSCRDVDPPQFIKCPHIIEAYAGPKQQPVAVTWSTPNAKDSSGQSVRVTSTKTSGSLFSPGLSSVLFIATDTAGNSQKCHTTIHVTVKSCSSLVPPANSKVTCSHNNDYGSECVITCDTTHLLNGEAKRTCQENLTWSGHNPQCLVRSCPQLPRISHGFYNCSNGREYQKSCSLSCDEGFRMIPPYVITCNRSIHWSQPGYCFDVEAPEFPDGCPDMNVTAARLGHPTVVRYSLPNVTDNSEEFVRIKASHQSGTFFNLGMTTVTLTAEDSNKNSDSCQFVVNVRNSSCGEPNLDPDKGLLKYNCPNGYVDGARCDLTCQDPKQPVKGVSTITCEKRVTDNMLEWRFPSNERPYCSATTCPELADPVHGSWACNANGNGEICALICEKNYTHTRGLGDLFHCTEGSWGRIPVGCTRPQRRPKKIESVSKFYYLSENCNANKTAVKENFLMIIAQSNFASFCTGNVECTIDTVSVTCGTSNLGHRRKKRLAAQYKYEISLRMNLGTVQVQSTPAETQQFYNTIVTSINAQFEKEANEGHLIFQKQEDMIAVDMIILFTHVIQD